MCCAVTLKEAITVTGKTRIVVVGQKNPMWQTQVEVLCKICGKSRYYAPSKLKKLQGYCLDCVRRYGIGKKKLKMEERKPYIDQLGYAFIYLPKDHWCSPMTGRGHKQYLSQHRLVMAEHLGRLLKPREYVHHINGVKTDNRIENLKLVTHETHPQFYSDAYKDGFRAGQEVSKDELMKQIKLLRLEVKQLKVVKERI